jgi:hypothetical protein
MSAPLETREQAQNLPAVRAVRDSAAAQRKPGAMGGLSFNVLLKACTDARVKLGAFDVRILGWLAGFGPEESAVIAGLITRAAAPRITQCGCGDDDCTACAQGAVLGQVLADAIAYRDPSGACADCEQHPAGLCQDHAEDLDRTDAYLALARDLGIEVDR